MNFVRVLGLILMVAFEATAWAAEVTASVDRKQVGVGDVVNYTISISSQESITVEEPRLPPIKGFDLINTSTGVETRSVFENGRFLTSQSRNFNYMFTVNEQGTLSIPAIEVMVDGSIYKTQPISISVSNARQAPRAGRGGQQAVDPFAMLDQAEEELFNQLLRRNYPGGARPPGPGPAPLPSDPTINPNDAFFIRAEVDKQSVYVGEQITASFYLYTRGQIRDIDTLKYPDLKGFWKEELEMATRLNFEQVVLNGVLYNRALLVSYALFPIKAGKATVDAYKAKCTVLTANAFGFGKPYQFTKASRPIAIEVREVPGENRPAGFTGAVGSFRMSAAFEPSTSAVNQPATLKVRIDGRGNAKLIELPKIDLPPSLELYDQKTQAKFLKDGTSHKEFEVLVIPREPGVFKVPALEMAAFDPSTNKFTRVATEELTLTVTGTATPNPALATSGGTPGSQAPSGPTLPGLASELQAGRDASLPLAGVTLMVYLFTFGFLGKTAWTKLRRRPKRVSLHLVLQRRLKNIRELIAAKEFRRVGVEMTNAAYSILGQLSEEGGANQELSRILEKCPPSLRRELADAIRALLGQCEALSFAPEAMIGDMTDKSKLQKLLAEFERVLARAIELGDVQ